jgi:hypothetical protein
MDLSGPGIAQVNYVIIVKWISLVRVLTLNKKKERKKEGAGLMEKGPPKVK